MTEYFFNTLDLTLAAICGLSLIIQLGILIFQGRYRWEVFYNVPFKKLGIRKIRFWGKISGVDWSKYKTQIKYSTICDTANLEKLKSDIETILNYERNHGKCNTKK